MATGTETVSFDAIIQADRQRRKNEELANQILGKGPKARTQPTAVKRKAGSGPSLASRVGIAKVSQRPFSSNRKPAAKVEAAWGHDLHHVNNPQASRISRLSREITKTNRLFDAAINPEPLKKDLNGSSNVKSLGNGISIRGLAGPYVVVGSNFAPGTTSADIESAMTPVGGEMESCRVITSSPTVIAEIVFADKAGAENVIATFNNQKADGRLLHVYMKVGPPTPVPPLPVRATPAEPKATRPDLTRAESSYDKQREQSDRVRRRAEFQDGSYGFEAKENKEDVEMKDTRDLLRDDWRQSGRGRDIGRGRDYQKLYSDDLYPRFGRRGFR
ncbi:hypothetical protein MMC20_002160 [Loxospora ochrophaea]|nr:hypothetical protein [Loxospora ochrophaea]